MIAEFTQNKMDTWQQCYAVTRRARGETVPIVESYVSPDVFDLLPLEDKETINALKLKALMLYLNYLNLKDK